MTFIEKPSLHLKEFCNYKPGSNIPFLNKMVEKTITLQFKVDNESDYPANEVHWKSGEEKYNTGMEEYRDSPEEDMQQPLGKHELGQKNRTKIVHLDSLGYKRE